jgi:glycosyltransferase involved in cell wall biosynthesis
MSPDNKKNKKILYIASAVVAPGSHGGATHVVEVASELSKLGYELHVVCARSKFKDPSRLSLAVAGGSSIRFYRYAWPKTLAWLTYPAIRRLAAKIQPAIIMERYYNFAGAGMAYAHRHHLPTLLEVNALMLDPKRSLKRRLDRFILFNRLKWWTETQCKWANTIVTPLHTTVPASLERSKISELPWGANVARFDPALIDPHAAALLRIKLGLPPASPKVRVAVFAGSFRHWHGVETLVQAAQLLLQKPRMDVPQLYFLLLGDGPLFVTIKNRVETLGLSKFIKLVGSVEYNQMPLYLSLADFGVAPFDTSRHAPLREAGFFWSPLKIFEYMALSLPTITPDLRPLNEIIRARQEGFLYCEGDVKDLAQVLEQAYHSSNADLARMGQSARERVVAKYSWAAHSAELDKLIQSATN